MSESGFRSPPQEMHDESWSPYEPQADAAAEVAGAGEGPRALYQALAARLERRVAEEGEGVVALSLEDVQGTGNVVGVGLGSLPADAGGAVNLYLIEPMREEEVREALASELGSEASAVPLNLIVTGEIEAHMQTMHLRPAPGGASVGHVDITAGTLGCLARGRSGDRIHRLLALSNNHVFADSNAGTFGDIVVQPGPHDGGIVPTHMIGRLERFVPIDFSGAPNFVDCATAWVQPDLVRTQILDLSSGVPQFFSLGGVVAACEKGTAVGKSGRTTQLTRGRITDCDAVVRVRFEGRTAIFRDQIAIKGPPEELFSRPGDSGSVVWTVEGRRPVGLLFAGGGGTTFANKIHHVLDALDIDLVT